MNKKRVMKVVTILLTMVLLVQTSYAVDFPIRVVLNGVQVYFPDGNPFTDKSSRILVPVRFVSEQLGAEVDWNKNTQTVTVQEENKVVTLVIGKKEIKINGTIKQLDTNATLKNSRTYVPIRFISEALGAEVKWDGKARTVYINNGKEPLPQTKVFRAGPFSVSSEGVTNSHVTEDSWSFRTAKKLSVSGEKVIDESRCIGIIAPSQLFPNFSEQCDEAASILKQAISENKVNEIINFVKKKTAVEVVIGKKTFYDGQYEIVVSDSNGENVNIKIYYK